MKIISLIFAIGIFMTGCASKHTEKATGSSASSSSSKADKNSNDANAKPAETAQNAPAPAPTKDMYKTTAEVSLRVSATPTSKVSMKIMKGEPVELIEKVSDDCWKIIYRGEPGYASPKNLSK
ncbi:MAG: SH3 domain-containing protein [Bacteroidia bacterium]